MITRLKNRLSKKTPWLPWGWLLVVVPAIIVCAVMLAVAWLFGWRPYVEIPQIFYQFSA